MLDFIYSKKKRVELERILLKHKASHNERIYLVSFLAYCGLSADDISTTINKYNKWNDYNKSYSDYQIRSLCHDINPSNYNKQHLHQDNIDRTIYCNDHSIFSKLNKDFFKDATIAVYECELKKYNYGKKTIWNPLSCSVYRRIIGKNHCLFVVDLDGDVEVAYGIAKNIYETDRWDFAKYSGNRGFHLIRKVRYCDKEDLLEMLREIYLSNKTNLLSFTSDSDMKKTVNLDPSMSSLYRLIRGYCIHLKTCRFSIPTDFTVSLNDIIDISKSFDKTREYLNEFDT